MAPLSLRSTFKLNSGFELPLLGFGVSQTGIHILQLPLHNSPGDRRHGSRVVEFELEAQIPVPAPLPSLTHPDSYPGLTFPIPPPSPVPVLLHCRLPIKC